MARVCTDRLDTKMRNKYDGFEDDNVTCSFCGRTADEAAAMVEGPNGTYVCESCVAASAEAMMLVLGADLKMSRTKRLVWTYDVNPGRWEVSGSKRRAANAGPTEAQARLSQRFLRPKGIPTPKEIYQRLSEHVIGQDEAKRALAVTVYNHYARILSAAERAELLTYDKSNVLMFGPSGCGKTLLARTLAEIINVPLAIADATTLTEAGYVGEDVESVLRLLLDAAGGDVKRAETGIVFIDEIDKIARCRAGSGVVRDVNGEGVQQALLKLIEGTHARVPENGKKTSNGECIEMDTSKILFIMGGAFPGLEEIIAKRTTPSSIGFGAQSVRGRKEDAGALLTQATPLDFEEFGMLPEFIGRTQVMVSLKGLDEDALVLIQTEPARSLVKQFQELFAGEGCELTFTEGALRSVAREALGLGVGARGLRAIYERVLRPAMFELPGHMSYTVLTVRETDVLGETVPELQERYKRKPRHTYSEKAAVGY